MKIEVMRYKLNELRMMLNDGEHTEEQGILVDIIKELDKAENKGEWIPLVEENGDDYIEAYDIAGVHTFAARYRCDKCGFIHFCIEDHGEYNFCPNCGADMRGVSE